MWLQSVRDSRPHFLLVSRLGNVFIFHSSQTELDEPPTGNHTAAFEVLLFAGVKPIWDLEERREAKLPQSVDHAVGQCQADHFEDKAIWEREPVIANFSVVLFQSGKNVE